MAEHGHPAGSPLTPPTPPPLRGRGERTPDVVEGSGYAIVTGGSRGIGKEIVATLAKNSAEVAFDLSRPRKRQPEATRERSQQLKHGGVAKAYQGDVADPETAKRIVDAVMAEWEPGWTSS